MNNSVIDRITYDRTVARQAKDTNTYQILTQILGNYQTGATLKKPKVGEGAMIACVREIVTANIETLALLEKNNADGRHAAKIEELQKQNTVLSQYLPVLLTAEELQTILVNLILEKPVTIGDFQKHLRENYADRFKPGTAAQVYAAT